MKDLLGDQGELSADLEWMLQSGQASKSMLAEALMAVYYEPVYRLALSMIEDEEEAHQAAIETFRRALLNLERYRSDRGVSAWLYRLAIESGQRARRSQSWRKLFSRPAGRGKPGRPSPVEQVDEIIWPLLDRLSGRVRLMVFLSSGLGWEPGRIAALLRESEPRIQGRLNVARQAFQAALTGQEVAQAGVEVDAEIRSSLARRWPARPVTPGELRWAGEAVLQDIERRRRGLSLTISISEFLWVGAFVLLLAGVVWVGNRMLAPAGLGYQPSPTPLAAVVAGTPAREQPSPSPSQTSGPTDRPAPSPSKVLLYFARPGDTLRVLAARLGASLDELERRNPPLTADDLLAEGREIQVPYYPPPEAALLPTLVRPSVLDLPPLDQQSTSEDIYTFLLLSERLWHTLWADAVVTRYGPPGFVGQPLTSREMAWVSQPARSRMLIGPLAGRPRYYGIIRDGWLYFSYPGENRGWLREAHEPLEGAQIHDLVFPGRADWILGRGEFRPAGDTYVAGRPALAADWYNQDGIRERRVWIDTQTGVILMQSQFDAQDEKTLIGAAAIIRIVFNLNLETGLFDPGSDWDSGFTRGDLGAPIPTDMPDSWITSGQAPGHERLDYTPPPPGFDPAAQLLTFQYPPESPVANVDARGRPLVDLFAGEYYLGQVELARPWGLRCARSPDGLKIAYSPGSHWLDFSPYWWMPSRLYWFELGKLEQVHEPVLGIEPADFAFAPDSRRIAVFGYDLSGGVLLIVDTSTGFVKNLASMDYATSLTWSPDGEYLALIGTSRDWAGSEGRMIRVENGEWMYRIRIEDLTSRRLSPERLDPGWPAPNWPGHAWKQVEFPILERGLGSCTGAPPTLPVTGADAAQAPAP